MPTIIENRRNLHQIPEIELTTQKTAQYIENVLDLYDCTIDHPIPNSVTAFFDNKKEKTIVFRSDMDALPMEENTDLEFKSTNGCMHACGHDGHMAMVLEIAKYTKQRITLISARRRKTRWGQANHRHTILQTI